MGIMKYYLKIPNKNFTKTKNCFSLEVTYRKHILFCLNELEACYFAVWLYLFWYYWLVLWITVLPFKGYVGSHIWDECFCFKARSYYNSQMLLKPKVLTLITNYIEFFMLLILFFVYYFIQNVEFNKLYIL